MKIGIAGTGKNGRCDCNAPDERSVTRSWSGIVRAEDKPKRSGGRESCGDAARVGERRSRSIISILTNAAAIDALTKAQDGLLAGDIKGKLFIEMSTVRPAD